MTTLKKFSYAALIAASVLNMLIAGATLAGLFLVDTRNGLNGTEYWLVGNQAFLVATLLVFIGTLVLFYLLAKGRPEKNCTLVHRRRTFTDHHIIGIQLGDKCAFLFRRVDNWIIRGMMRASYVSLCSAFSDLLNPRIL